MFHHQVSITHSNLTRHVFTIIKDGVHFIMNSESVANISIPLIKVFIIERTNLLAILTETSLAY